MTKQTYEFRSQFDEAAERLGLREEETGFGGVKGPTTQFSNPQTGAYGRADYTNPDKPVFETYSP